MNNDIVEDAIPPGEDLFEYHRSQVLKWTKASLESTNQTRMASNAELAKAHAILAAALVSDRSRRI
jgi:hypothetical protein